jgi:hypothetical protein
MSARKIRIGGLLVLGIAGGIWYAGSREKAVTVADVMADPGRAVDADGNARRIDVGNADDMMKSIMKDQQERLDRFFALTDKPSRDKFLDEMIDEQEKVRAAIGEPAQTPPPPSDKPVDVQTKTDSGDGRVDVRQTIRINGNAMEDHMSPEFKARLAEFARAMSDRRAERGLPPAKGIAISVIREKTN